MNRKTDIISIKTLEQVPRLEMIKSISRDKKLKLVFASAIHQERERIGKNLKEALPGFQVGIPIVGTELNISKLITLSEIDEHQNFFENCAKDYRKLAENLLWMLVGKLNLQLNRDFPLETFNTLKRNKRQSGKINQWRYFVHGFHCGFEHSKTGQIIEVPLVFGLEFGDLDPYFFSRFIKSTPEYQPLPIAIYEDYADGLRIITRMVELGKFEKIRSNIGGLSGTVVVDREKVAIKSHKEIEKLYHLRNQGKNASKFNFWKIIGLKK